ALRTTLNDQALDPAFREQVLSLPSETMVAEQMEVVDPQAIHAARQFMRVTLAQALKADFLSTYEDNLTPKKYSPDPVSAGKRGLKNQALSYLLEWPDASTRQLAQVQYDAADNMTDRVAALSALLNAGGKTAAKSLQHFYK